MPFTATDDQLDLAFFALSDPTRRSILSRLADDDAGIVDLTAHFAMSQPAITKHVRVLERAGLVSRRKEGQRRPCHLEPDRLAQLSEWLGSYRQYWEASFDRLDNYIDELTHAPDPNQEKT
ncbi:MAG: metalloregulator ArsR/SmtB family transcription factor [bacterium]|nr:metalloregulator ArsR/SmtB family transcription factor [bacterium]